MMRILVAGIGNIFLGDDAFGVEVVRALEQKRLAEGVVIRDFGIRGYDLVCALTEGYSAVVLVDAVPRGEPPGTLCLLEPELAKIGRCEEASLDAHNLDPVRVLQAARNIGELPDRLYLVGCEPGELGEPEGQMGLTAPVLAAVPKAVEMIESIVKKLLSSETRAAGAVPV